ncbi:hypothetical protein EPN81_02255 [Patescibacteria group bacterium]|nr:MAG: hypothetical protein EPN81_02255 [Patescibacteria group bacterium]
MSEPTGELTMRDVAQLNPTADAATLRQLILGNQLVVSQDGLHCAHIVVRRHEVERVVHSQFGVLEPSFQRTSPREGTRILGLDGRSVLVWGVVEDHPTGLWRLDGTGGGTFLTRLDTVMRPGSASGGLVRGTRFDRPREHLCLSPWGDLWPIHERAVVTPHQGGLCVVEEIAGILYAYELRQSGGIDPFKILTIQNDDRLIGIVSWQGRLMLALSRGSQSWLVELNPRAMGEVPERIQIDGNLQGVWSSPGNMTMVLLVHPRGEPEGVHRLQLSEGWIIHKGRFSLDPSSIVWSPNEFHLAATIHEGAYLDRLPHERIVGSRLDQPIPPGLHVREKLIADDGSLVATIQCDGEYDQPIIMSQAGTPVPLAWNLHSKPDGRISWTTVHGDRILTWTQGTAIV